MAFPLHGPESTERALPRTGSADGHLDPVQPEGSLEVRLERGEVVPFGACPFATPAGEDRAFLLRQRTSKRIHRGVRLDGPLGLTGLAWESNEQADRVRQILAEFSERATGWLGVLLPRYRTAWEVGSAAFQPEEEAIRAARTTARSDLVHIDAAAERPSQGRRLLRLFVNASSADPCVWVTSEPFAHLLERYGKEVGLPADRLRTWWTTLRENAARLVGRTRTPLSAYDNFMHRFGNFLKANEKFQERCPKQYRKFPPSSAWLAMTDAASHAVVRGQYILDQSYWVPSSVLALPEEAPAALLARMTGPASADRWADAAGPRGTQSRIVLAGKVEDIRAGHETSHPVRHW